MLCAVALPSLTYPAYQSLEDMDSSKNLFWHATDIHLLLEKEFLAAVKLCPDAAMIPKATFPLGQ